MTTYIFGGSFDPITNDHMAIIKNLSAKKENTVLIVPTYAHAFDKKLSPLEDRIKLIKKALTGYLDTNIVIGPLARTPFMVDYIKMLDVQYCSIVIGSDNIQELPKWKKYRKLNREHFFTIFERPGYPIFLEDIKHIRCRHMRLGFTKGISSTQVRERVKRGKSIKKLVPEAIAQDVEKYYANK